MYGSKYTLFKTRQFRDKVPDIAAALSPSAQHIVRARPCIRGRKHRGFSNTISFPYDISYHYIPSHYGIPGNEFADQWEKTAYCLDQSQGPNATLL
ncbi:hypothetical protein TNCT_504201 [Trichonephila clavata]|uniref:RNase H type-1 domain-containing protein n=1 Tax=Trichonephila clavata TaxID=2740835 RepID=A0A8X6L0E5_TRICU|nr:hypothetical protein TNCT_504201 [Trichonephila clavata]